MGLRNSTNIVQIEEVFQGDEYMDIVMERLGEELFQTITKSFARHRRGIEEEKAKIYFQDIVKGVGEMHMDFDLAHNDLKPENIMHTRAGDRLKLVDLGHCEAQNANAKRAAEVGGILGTVPYAAPEVILYGDKPGKRGTKLTFG